MFELQLKKRFIKFVMNKNVILVILTLFIVFIFGFILGYYLKSLQGGNGPINILPSSKVCHYNGHTYEPGMSFLDKDGCNTCGCENGLVACTLMVCE